MSSVNATRLPRLHLSTLLGLIFLCLTLTPATALAVLDEEPPVYKAVEPSSDQSRASVIIARTLTLSHFRDQKIDDELADRVMDAYLDALDDQRLYLTKDDIEQFDKHRDGLDRVIRNGQLQVPFRIYNHVQARTVERLQTVLAMLENGFDDMDFDTDETYRRDRKDEDWADSDEELNELWRKRLQNAVLDLRLEGEDDDAIKESLKRRYQSRLNRTLQSRTEDAFQVWMNAFTMLWDPHTQYLSPRVSENFDINMSLSLEGIGAVLQSDNEYTEVSRVVPGGPAAREGTLQTGDRIVGVGQDEDGEIENVIGMRLDEVVDRIRGPKESKVRLEVIPAGSSSDVSTREIVIQRDEVKLEEQAAQKEMLEFDSNGDARKIGVINIPTFYADLQAAQARESDYTSTTRDVRRLIEELKEDGMEGLVIDLRNNGGGALMEANSMVSLFVGAGPTVQVRGPDGAVQVYQEDNDNVAWDGPVIVLVNRLSASASEIFAGAMQDYGRAVVMGSQTFGKGTVQGIRRLNHGQLKMTQSKFYRISGDSMQHRGVIPDIEIPSRINKDRVGEDALDDALGWDQIDATDHRSFYDITSLLDNGVRERHEERFQAHPEYELLMREIELMEQQFERKEVSLNSERRKAEQEEFRSERLEVANKRRELQGKDPFESWQELEQDSEAAMLEGRRNPDQNRKEPDFIAKEAGQVLMDILRDNDNFASIFKLSDDDRSAAMKSD